MCKTNLIVNKPLFNIHYIYPEYAQSGSHGRFVETPCNLIHFHYLSLSLQFRVTRSQVFVFYDKGSYLRFRCLC